MSAPLLHQRIEDAHADASRICELGYELGVGTRAAFWALTTCESREAARLALRPFLARRLQSVLADRQGFEPLAALLEAKLAALDIEIEQDAPGPYGGPRPSPPVDLMSWTRARLSLGMDASRPTLRIPRQGQWRSGHLSSALRGDDGSADPRAIADRIAVLSNLLPIGAGWSAIGRDDALRDLVESMWLHLCHRTERMPLARAQARSTTFFKRLNRNALFFSNRVGTWFCPVTHHDLSQSLAVVEPNRVILVCFYDNP